MKTAIIKTRGFFAEFRKFAARGNVIDLAIGIVIGTSFNAVVNSLVTNVLTPPVGLLLGNIDFKDLALPLGGTVKITYGLFFQSFLSFVITTFTLFVLVRFVNELEEAAARKRRADAAQTEPVAEDSPEVAILKEIRDTLKTET